MEESLEDVPTQSPSDIILDRQEEMIGEEHSEESIDCDKYNDEEKEYKSRTKSERGDLCHISTPHLYPSYPNLSGQPSKSGISYSGFPGVGFPSSVYPSGGYSNIGYTNCGYMNGDFPSEGYGGGWLQQNAMNIGDGFMSNQYMCGDVQYPAGRLLTTQIPHIGNYKNNLGINNKIPTQMNSFKGYQNWSNPTQYQMCAGSQPFFSGYNSQGCAPAAPVPGQNLFAGQPMRQFVAPNFSALPYVTGGPIHTLPPVIKKAKSRNDARCMEGSVDLTSDLRKAGRRRRGCC